MWQGAKEVLDRRHPSLQQHLTLRMFRHWRNPSKKNVRFAASIDAIRSLCRVAISHCAGRAWSESCRMQHRRRGALSVGVISKAFTSHLFRNMNVFCERLSFASSQPLHLSPLVVAPSHPMHHFPLPNARCACPQKTQTDVRFCCSNVRFHTSKHNDRCGQNESGCAILFLQLITCPNFMRQQRDSLVLFL